ncbi:MAG: hypothetical protein LBR06_02560, partial [Bacteroidales bacterium]|nr:hypothetical protein [Bacteroidales bacterium]
YKLNQLQVEQSLKEAKRSIRLGFVSVVLGLASIVSAFVIPKIFSSNISSKDKIEITDSISIRTTNCLTPIVQELDTINHIIKADSIRLYNLQDSINKLIEQNKKIIEYQSKNNNK